MASRCHFRYRAPCARVASCSVACKMLELIDLPASAMSDHTNASAFQARRNETRLLRLMSTLRVNSGTAVAEASLPSSTAGCSFVYSPSSVGAAAVLVDDSNAGGFRPLAPGMRNLTDRSPAGIISAINTDVEVSLKESAVARPDMVPGWRWDNEMFRKLLGRRARFYSPMRCVKVSAMTRKCVTCQHVKRAEIDRLKPLHKRSQANRPSCSSMRHGTVPGAGRPSSLTWPHWPRGTCYRFAWLRFEHPVSQILF
jgi:hypothetical protein